MGKKLPIRIKASTRRASIVELFAVRAGELLKDFYQTGSSLEFWFRVAKLRQEFDGLFPEFASAITPLNFKELKDELKKELSRAQSANSK